MSFRNNTHYRYAKHHCQALPNFNTYLSQTIKIMVYKFSAALVFVAALLLFGSACTVAQMTAKSPRIFGYTIKGDSVIFQFDPKDYKEVRDNRTFKRFKLKAFGYSGVFITGEFNDWRTVDYKMRPNKEGVYELSKSIKQLGGKGSKQFRIVLNGESYALVPPDWATNTTINYFDKRQNFILVIP